MSTFKKTIFLTNKESNNKGMAILTLQKQNKGVFCTIKAYDVKKSSHLILGLKCDNNIIKQNINLDNNIYNFLLNQEINLEKNLGCVLLDNSDNNIVPLLWGSEKSDNFKSQIISNLKNSIQKLQGSTQCMPKVNMLKNNPINEDAHIAEQSISIDNQMSFIDDEQVAENQTHISSIPENSEIAQAVPLSNLFESDEEEIEETIDNNLKDDENITPHKFYDMIAEQLDELFERYPREQNLENLVENSKWVKVKYEDENRYYVVGLIYLNYDIKYICYGVPGDYYTDPPQHLKNYSQWLPTNPIAPYTEGFWVMYQDADTGENVLIN